MSARKVQLREILCRELPDPRPVARQGRGVRSVELDSSAVQQLPELLVGRLALRVGQIDGGGGHATGYIRERPLARRLRIRGAPDHLFGDEIERLLRR